MLLRFTNAMRMVSSSPNRHRDRLTRLAGRTRLSTDGKRKMEIPIFVARFLGPGAEFLNPKNLIVRAGGISVPTHPSAARVSLTLVLISIFAPAAPSLRAQADQWERHMKSGSRAYSVARNQKYCHG
jgi:hypothetical protein